MSGVGAGLENGQGLVILAPPQQWGPLGPVQAGTESAFWVLMGTSAAGGE